VLAIDVGDMARGDAYVAMTRATRSLSMLGNQPVGLPRP